LASAAKPGRGDRQLRIKVRSKGSLSATRVGLGRDSGYNRRLFCQLIKQQENPMRHPMISAAFLAAAAVAAPPAARAQGDVEAGQIKAYTCTGCHGIPGYNNVYPTYKVPKIGGQNYPYLVAAMKAYRAGDRQHPTMELQARSLSDRDIEDIAAYFSSLGADEQRAPR
jgi:cytochrome c553